MGIGFDAFKANLGWNLADSVMGSISDAIEKNAEEQAAREEAEKYESDKNDIIRTLVFMVGNKISLNRTGKKAIASVLSTIQEENISLFSIEDEIDACYSELQNQNLKKYFSNISAINTDREQTCIMYVIILSLYMQLSQDGVALPIHVYNLALIKQFFAIDRKELAACYEILAERLEKDIDDVADIFEELTSEESIEKIKSENPTIVYDESASTLPTVSKCENPKEEIERVYTTSIQEVAEDDEFKKRFFLADSNPKKILVAVKAYAKNCKDEEILTLYDDSVFCNGKVGFLLTNKKIYICNSFEKPQEIELNSITDISVASKSAITINNIKIDTAMLNEKGTEIVCNFLQLAVPIAMQIEVKQ